MREEDLIQQAVCNYLAIYYPDVIYFSDMSGAWLKNIVMAQRHKSMRKDDFKVPDLIILEPNYNWHGLLIEIKSENVKIYRRDNKTFSSEQIRAQAKSLELLEKKKYYATFGIGEAGCINIIEKYMNNEV